MTQISTDRVTVLLVCPPGLEQKSLYTIINSVPAAAVIARVSDLEVAKKITQLRKPDIMVIDSTFLTYEAVTILKGFKQLHRHTTCVALAATSTQKSRWEDGGADFVVKYKNLNQEFPLIVRQVQKEIDARLTPPQ